MAAPKGNKFWQLRSKHGREKLFATPELLWEAACEYFEWCDNNPWKMSVVTKGGIVELPKTRPYTVTGLCLYLDACESYWRTFRRENHEDFLPIVTRIDKIIETQQFTGAAVGEYNANIIARKLGIEDKVSIKQENIIKGLSSEKIAEMLADE